jgi:hypothetical protein
MKSTINISAIQSNNRNKISIKISIKNPTADPFAGTANEQTHHSQNPKTPSPADPFAGAANEDNSQKMDEAGLRKIFDHFDEDKGGRV